MSHRQSLLTALQGQTVRIPDLQSLFEDWPQDTNPKLDQLRGEVDRKLEELFTPGKRLQQTKLANLALFSANWWPYAGYHALRAAALLSIWLFTWDDETDSTEFTSLADNFDRADSFREETLRYIRQCMNIRSDSPMRSCSSPSNRLISSFKCIADAVLPVFSAHERQTLLHELEDFVRGTELEQRSQIDNVLPTVEQYIERRMASGGVGVNLAMHECALGISLADKVREDPDMAIIWRQTNLIICIVNDMLSIKKEIAQYQVDSLIPLLFRQYGTLQIAMDEAFRAVCVHKSELDGAAVRLLGRYELDENPEMHLAIERFVDSCRFACTGNLNWSVTSGRYKLGTTSLKDGVTISV